MLLILKDCSVGFGAFRCSHARKIYSKKINHTLLHLSLESNSNLGWLPGFWNIYYWILLPTVPLSTTYTHDLTVCQANFKTKISVSSFKSVSQIKILLNLTKVFVHCKIFRNFCLPLAMEVDPLNGKQILI